MFLQIDVPDQPIRRVRLTRRSVVIGRDNQADLQIDHPQVPAFLCQLESEGHDRWTLRTLTTGTTSITTGMQLQPGQAVIVGPVKLRLQSTAPKLRACPICGTRMAEKAVLCVHCGYDQRTGRRVDDRPMPYDLTPPTVEDPPPGAPGWAHMEPEAEDAMRMAGRNAVVMPWRDYGAANSAMLCGLIALVASFLAFPPERPLPVALGLSLSLVFNTGFLVAAAIIASHWGVLEFGELNRGVLKCAAVQVVTMAVLQWLPSEETLAIWAPGLSLFGPIVAHMPRVIVSLGMPFVLLRYFFDLDWAETFVLSLAVAVVMYLAMVLMWIVM